MNKGKELYDEIVRLAYGFYEKRGRVHGYDLGDWLRAERIGMERHAGEIAREAALAGAKKSGKTGRREQPRAAKRPRQPSRKAARK